MHTWPLRPLTLINVSLIHHEPFSDCPDSLVHALHISTFHGRAIDHSHNMDVVPILAYVGDLKNSAHEFITGHNILDVAEVVARFTGADTEEVVVPCTEISANIVRRHI